MKIENREIGRHQPPYIIAELSANHNGSLETACKVVDEAAKAGADAVKLQTYTADTITIKSDKKEFQIKGGLWHGRTLYDLYEQAYTPWEWHAVLFAHAKKRGITIFSSPFDPTAADFLDELGAPAFKIASFEAIDLPLIRYVAGKRKPMIISTGMANLEEIEEAVQAAREGGCEELALLHCVSGYPAPPEDYKLATIADMERRFGVPIGLSDHTLNNVSAVAAVALGATVIEKHFTLDRNGGGPDDSFSLEPSDLEQLCRDARIAWEAIGSVDYGLKSSERSNAVFRRSLYAVQDIVKGSVITEEHVRSIRPGYGLAPKHLNQVIGSIAREDIPRASAMRWELIKTKS
ncbi:pseudaminic acid synthase [Pseudogemmobacter faecipullorum]|uniref:Pseudaminic acid synthase n=1 Tax=Pseudogemmobacter faecipullorum TaxID=2755041 RepID=A0ABS8CRG5_9RHOB|nr:pseudaminic acid synthase [Pseudogemmobacter faecipullorum]MCB5411979.1 pseudaminic acid synthase [Pseudogemmobacter faecipullorum]